MFVLTLLAGAGQAAAPGAVAPVDPELLEFIGRLRFQCGAHARNKFFFIPVRAHVPSPSSAARRLCSARE